MSSMLRRHTRSVIPAALISALLVLFASRSLLAQLPPLKPAHLNPMIEKLAAGEAVKNIDEIASVPGVGVINAAAAGDLATSMGISGQLTAPEVEAHRQTILTACLAHHVVCGILANGTAQVDQRLKEGWKMLTTPSGTAAQ